MRGVRCERHDGPCRCHVRPIASRTWYGTGALHYEAGKPFDTRYPIDYQIGWKDAECFKRDELQVRHGIR